MIRIDEPTDAGPLHLAVRSLADVDWVVFTSVNGVKRFWRALRDAGLDTGDLAEVSVCAIGEATARAIEEEGTRADLVPEQYVAEAVVQSLAAGRDLSGIRILLPRAENARDTLPVELGRLGAIVRDVPAYRTVPVVEETTALKVALESGEVDMVTFTSGSAARSFAEQVTSDLGRALVATIGPVTSSVAAGLGWLVAFEAATHTAAGLADAIVRFYQAKADPEVA
jgi:uroporphyrinogen III methyltransferase/synthase